MFELHALGLAVARSDPATLHFRRGGGLRGKVVFRPRLFAQRGACRAPRWLPAWRRLGVVLMLGAISLTFRYRMDLYPALDFACALGLAAMVAGEALP